MYSFKRLISRYSKTPPELKVVAEGYYDYSNGGVWVDGDVEWVEFEGAVVPLGEEVTYDNARLTTEDRKLYTYHDVSEGMIVSYKARLYTIMEIDDYGDFDDNLTIAVLKAGGVND